MIRLNLLLSLSFSIGLAFSQTSNLNHPDTSFLDPVPPNLNKPEIDTSSNNRPKIFALPIFFITPDTRLGGGAGGILTFRSPNDPQASNLTFSLVYTQRKQLLIWFPYQVYFGKGKYVAFGELGWFRYIYQFFGIGNNIHNDYVEKYSTDYPRIRATVLRRSSHGNAFGLRFAYDHFDITRYDSSGLLLQKNITGWQGGRSIGGGLVWWKDTRNNRFYPSSGWFIESALYVETKWLGSQYQFSRLSIEAARYLSLGEKSVLALHTTAIGTLGDPPFFNNQAFLGGAKRLRGYFEGKYRDDHLLLAQAELRQVLFGRFGGVLFSGAGTVFGTRNETAKIRPNAGLGIRFQVDKKQKINIRMDYGFGVKNQGFYLTFGEAF